MIFLGLTDAKDILLFLAHGAGEKPMDLDEFKKAFIEEYHREPADSMEARVMNYINMSGRGGASFSVLRNRMKVVTKAKEEELIEALHGLHTSGRIHALMSAKKYNGKRVAKWCAVVK
jgi:hypothetical protein